MKYSVPVLLLAITLAAGCHLLQPTPKKSGPVELPPATEVETQFRDRWISRRVHELMAAGTAKSEDEAKAMAAAEFAKQYPYIRMEAAK